MKVNRSLLAEWDALRWTSPGLVQGLRQGDRRSLVQGKGMEFADHRPYTPGDDLRLVDWNSYARFHKLFVRLFHDDRNLMVHLLLDASASMGLGTPRKADYAADVAAGLALVALRARDTIAVECTAGTVKHEWVTGQQLHAFRAVLSLLTTVEPAGVADMANALKRLAARRRVDRTVLLTDLLVPEAERNAILRLLAVSSFYPILLHVLGPQELAPDFSQPQRLNDAETKQSLTIPAGPSAKAAYQRGLAKWLSAIRAQCRNLRIRYVPAVTTQPVRTLVTEPLRRNRLLTGRRGGG